MTLKGPWEFESPSCAGIGVDLFYRNDPDETMGHSKNEEKQIIEVCKSCPCIQECAEWGIARERWGIWGGLSPKERELIRRRRRRVRENHENLKLLP